MNGDVTDTPLSPIKQAYLKLQEMQSRLDATEQARREPIAIVGMACRFPGNSNDPESFWRLLREGRDAIREVPKDRWDIDAFYDPNPGTPGKMYTRNGAFLDRVDLFEPQFFGIAPREAVRLDPQQRLLLEVVWEALERSGLAPDSLSETRTGVFVGVCTSDYSDLQARALDVTQLDAYHASGIAHSMASGRVSYVLGLQGPSMTLDTACSSSLVAVHLACQSLRRRECMMALAGGVNVILTPDMFIALSKASMLARDGRCKTFDASADGYARGEGCGVVVLKRLSDALANGDPILALIRGSAINQDGPSSGLTAPNGPAQTSVIHDALADAGVTPDQVSYLETHGTGTSLGDPIEVQALAAAYCGSRTHRNPLLIGALKSNIGHLEAAAGVAGLIKLALAFENRQIPASLHVNKPNPFIPWDDLSVKVMTALSPWEVDGGRRMAGLSSFGFSGTNAHLVLEEPPMPQAVRPAADRPRHLLALSARSEEALRTLAGKYGEHIESHPDDDIGNICYTVNAGRAHWPYRAAIPTESAADLRAKLTSVASGVADPADIFSGHTAVSDVPKPVFLFAGQGSQFAGMGWELYQTQPAFRTILDRCREILHNELPSDLLSVMYPAPGDTSALDETAFTQPALFSLEYALTQLWLSWGVVPSVVMGHSVGEYVAACAAGVFSLEEGLKLIAARGRLMQEKCERGVMAAVGAEEALVASELAGYRRDVSIAALNGPTNTVISGRREAVEELIAKFAEAGVKCKRLTVSHAFHSPLMDPMLDEFRSVAARVKYNAPQIPLISNLSGRVASAEELTDPGYWVRHVRQPVIFSTSIKTLHERGCQTFVELGPTPTLLGMAAKCLPEGFGTWLPSLRKGRGDWQQILDSLAALYVRGAEVNWKAFDRDYGRRPVVLPTYPFQRSRYWVHVPKRDSRKSGDVPDKVLNHPLLNHRIDSPFTDKIVIEARLSGANLPWLKDHQAFGSIVFPATAYLEIVLAAAKETFGTRAFVIRQMDIREAMIIDGETTQRVQIAIAPEDGDQASFQVASIAAGEESVAAKWKIHASGQLESADACERELAGRGSLEKIRSRCTREISVETYHQQFSDLGMYLGPSFRGLHKLWGGTNEVLGEVRLVPAISAEAPFYQIHPGMLDPCLQPFAAAALSLSEIASGNAIYMPVAIGSYSVYRDPGETLWSHVVVSQRNGQAASPKFLAVDVSIFDPAGALVAELRGLSLRRVERQMLVRMEEEPLRDWLYELSWKEAPLPEATRATGPASLHNPPEIAEELRVYTARHSEDVALVEFASAFPELEALSTRYVSKALGELGWRPQKHERFTTETKAAELSIPAKYHRLFGRMLEMLEEDSTLERRNDGWEVCGAIPTEESGVSAGQLLQRYPECSAELKMTIRCGEHLARVIRGECEPLDLLFPGGSVHDIEKLYRDSPFARFYNGLVGTAVRALMRRCPTDRPLRVLEIGAGTGSTTASVLPELAGRRATYVFTDASPLFFSTAKQKFGKYPFVQYRLLDIEKDPLEQGFDPHSYDLVIAANVLHATEDLRATLKNVRTLLASEGILLLLEGTRPLRFGDLIVGLTDGWWRFKDSELRPRHALISVDKWRILFEDSGFTAVTAGPETGGILANQALLLAQAPRVCDNRLSLAPRPASRSWIIFADRSGLGERLHELLEVQGARCTSVIAGEKFELLGKGRYQISTGNLDDIQRLLQEIARENGSTVEGIVYLWPLDLPSGAITGCDDLKMRVESGCEGLLHLVKAVAAEGTPYSFWIVTRGGQAVDSSVGPAALAQVPVSAIGSTIALEHPELRCCRIDLDPDGELDETSSLCAELQAGHEDLVAFRGGRRYIARLKRARLHQAAENRESEEKARAYRLHSSSPGLLDCLALERMQRRSPPAGEVEVEVLATGLNFRDVLIALGRYPNESQVFGYECAGEVVGLGEGVHDVQLGQLVMAMASGSFASHVTVPTAHLIPVPEFLSNEEAASIPSAFLTAYYALCYLGRITSDDRILIHAAAGGVGLAAVQLAQRAGAEIFATAGSASKREYLKSLGVAHVMDSRSLDFAAEIMQATGGKGVDIVLNSLAGEFIGKTFSVMGENGRFLEIGETGTWDKVRVSQLNRNISYHPINLVATFQQDPQLIARLLAELMNELEQGRLKPLPLRIFPIEQVSEAFRYMARARHIGKIVVTHRSPPCALRKERAEVPAARAFDPDAGYMITGGLAGLGLLAAEWLVRNNARYLVLTGRSAPSAQTLEAIGAMEREGVQVVIAVGDVSDRNHVKELIAKFGGARPRLAGVIHCAGALDDGMILHQNRERFQKVFAAKVAGSWHLHELTQDLPLDFFVMFSSAVSLLGSAGQANHVAACAFEDGLAHYRRALGLPALSIDWGPWGETGAATRVAVSRRSQLKGFRPIQPERGFRVLKRLLEGAPARIGVISVDWRQYSASLFPGSTPALLSELGWEAEARAPKVQEKKEPLQAFIERLHGAAPSKQQTLLGEYVREQARKVLGLAATQPIDYNQPLNDLGLDSLMAVELRSLLSAGLGLSRSLPATLVFDYPTITTLTGYLAKEVLLWQTTPAPEVDAPQGDDLAGLLERIEGLSEEEVDRIFKSDPIATEKDLL